VLIPPPTIFDGTLGRRGSKGNGMSSVLMLSSRMIRGYMGCTTDGLAKPTREAWLFLTALASAVLPRREPVRRICGGRGRCKSRITDEASLENRAKNA